MGPGVTELLETFVTLADYDTNSILADDANRAIWIPNVGWEVNKLATESARWCRSCMEYWSSYL